MARKKVTFDCNHTSMQEAKIGKYTFVNALDEIGCDLLDKWVVPGCKVLFSHHGIRTFAPPKVISTQELNALADRLGERLTIKRVDIFRAEI